MHILWLVRTTLPQAAAACGLAGASDVSGSWLTGQLAALRACPDLQLTVLCVGKEDADGTADGVHYRVVRDTAAFAPLLQAERPDLVHIWGTEFDPAAVMADAARASGLPVLFSVQGVMRDCAAHLCDGVPEKYRRSGALWHAIDKIIPGELLDKMQASFDALAAKEAAALADARYVTGRTAFDRAACAALAPHARYYPCNETLRPLFYTGTLWHARDFAAAPVLLLPQGNYPLKNLHTVIKALPAVLAEYGDAELRIAGWPPLDKGPLLRPVIDRMFPYKLYCKRLAAQLGVTEHIPLHRAAGCRGHAAGVSGGRRLFAAVRLREQPQQLRRGHAAGPALRRQRRGRYSFDAGERHRGSFVRRCAGRRRAGPRRFAGAAQPRRWHGHGPSGPCPRTADP